MIMLVMVMVLAMVMVMVSKSFSHHLFCSSSLTVPRIQSMRASSFHFPRLAPAAPSMKRVPKFDSHTTRTRRTKKTARNASSSAASASIPAECQLAGAQAAAEKRPLVSQTATGNNPKENTNAPPEAGRWLYGESASVMLMASGTFPFM